MLLALTLWVALPAAPALAAGLFESGSPCGAVPCERVVQLSFNQALGDTLIHDWYRLASYPERLDPRLSLVALSPVSAALGPRAATAERGGLQAPALDFRAIFGEPPFSVERFERNAEAWWKRHVLPLLDSAGKPATLLDLDLESIVALVGHHWQLHGLGERPVAGLTDVKVVRRLQNKFWILAQQWQLAQPARRALLSWSSAGYAELQNAQGRVVRAEPLLETDSIYDHPKNQQKILYGGEVSELPALRELLGAAAEAETVRQFSKGAGVEFDARPWVLVNLTGGASKDDSPGFASRMREQFAEFLLDLEPEVNVALILGDETPATQELWLRRWSRSGARLALVPADRYDLIGGWMSLASVIVTRDTGLMHVAYARLGKEGMKRLVTFGMDQSARYTMNVRYWAPEGARVVGLPLLEIWDRATPSAVVAAVVIQVKSLLRAAEKSAPVAAVATAPLAPVAAPFPPTADPAPPSLLSRALEWCRRALLGEPASP